VAPGGGTVEGGQAVFVWSFYGGFCSDQGQDCFSRAGACSPEKWLATVAVFYGDDDVAVGEQGLQDLEAEVGILVLINYKKSDKRLDFC
jgi:hypothetical protein